MAADTELRGKVEIDVSGAIASTRAVSTAYKNLAQAVNDTNSKMTVSQRTAGKALIAANDKTQTAMNKSIQGAAATRAKIYQEELKGTNDRKISRTKADAQVQTEGSRKALVDSKTMTEDMRRQDMLSKSILASQSRRTAGLSTVRYALYDVSRTVQRIGLALVGISAAPFGIAIAWEKAFANVDRTVQDLDFRQIAYLREQLIDVTRTMPVAFDKVAEVATLAGQMGISGHNIAGFTRTIAQFTATTGVSVDDAATAFGRLNSLVPDVQNNFGKLADSVVKVGVNSVATESQIVRVATEIASVAGQAGLASTEIVGLSGAIASVAVRPELARGIITRVFGRITRAVGEGGAKLQGFAELAGMSADKFKQSWGNPKLGKDTLLALFEGIRNQGSGAEGALRQLGITSVRDVPVLLRLANAMDSTGVAGALLKQTFKDSANAGGEMARQYSIISNTVTAKFQVLVQNVQAALDKIGSSNLGPLGDLLDSITDKIGDFTDTLDDSFKIFGLDTGKTNGEILGIVSVVTLALGAVLLLIAGLGSAAAGGIAMSQVFSALKAHMVASNVASVAAAEGFVAAGGAGTVGAVGVGRLSAALATLSRVFAPLAVLGIGAWATHVLTSTEEAGTSMEEFSRVMQTSAGGISDAVLTMEGLDYDNLGVGNFWARQFGWAEKTTQMFKTTAEYGKSLENIQSNGMTGDFFKMNFDKEEWTKVTETTKRIDDEMKNMIMTGQSFKAMDMFSEFVTSANLSDKAINGLLNSGKATKREMGSILQSLDLEKTDANFQKLARGTLPEYNAMVEAAKQTTDEFGNTIKSTEELANEFVDTVGKGLAGMVSSSSAWSDAVAADNKVAQDTWLESNDSLKDFTESGITSLDSFLDALDAQVAAQQEFATNLAIIYEKGGQDAALAAYTAGADATAALAKGSDDEFQRFLDIVPLMGEAAGTGMAQGISDLGAPAVIRAFSSMGKDGIAKARAEVISGTKTIEEVLAEFQPQFIVKAYTDGALQDALDLQAHINSLTAHMTVRVSEQVTRNLQPGGHPMQGGYAGANGMIHSYSSGGFASGIYAGRKGSIHKFAEPETRWEAYISGKPGQEKRNRHILLDAAARLGMNADALSMGGGGENKSGQYAPSAAGRRGGKVGVSVVELSAYDRQLLANAGNVHLSIGNQQVARANSAANTVAAKRGSN